MAGTGKVIALIKALSASGASPEEIKAAVAEWLAEHVDPDTGYVIDDTFSIPGAAPDAKLTGDELNELKSAITQLDGAVEELEQGSLSALGATAGQVPTADGEGAWEWADPTGTGMEKVAVSGSTPSITAESNKLYICGEVSTLSITPPASGIFGVIFESGSTPTVLTLGNGISCPDWFDDTSLEADTIYELNVNEGLLTVGMWEAV